MENQIRFRNLHWSVKIPVCAGWVLIVLWVLYFIVGVYEVFRFG